MRADHGTLSTIRAEPCDSSESGPNDGLVFDGGGYVAQNGLVQLDAPRFREGFAAITVDLDRTARLRTENTTWREDRAAYIAANPALPAITTRNGDQPD